MMEKLYRVLEGIVVRPGRSGVSKEKVGGLLLIIFGIVARLAGVDAPEEGAEDLVKLLEQLWSTPIAIGLVAWVQRHRRGDPKP